MRYAPLHGQVWTFITSSLGRRLPARISDLRLCTLVLWEIKRHLAYLQRRTSWRTTETVVIGSLKEGA